MKKNNYGKMLALALSATMALSLAACGTAPETSNASAAPTPTQSTAPGHVGTVLLSVNPEIEISYDKVGNVVALAGLNADGQSVVGAYADYEGRPCKTVIGELVSAINAGGYFDTTIDGQERNIVIKLERGSEYPSKGFLTELAQTVQSTVDTDQIGSRTVALDHDDYDDVHGDKGYINSSAAQNILATQLNRSDIQFLEKEYDLDDGDYEVEFMLDGVKYEYEVNARTGKVTEMDVDHTGNGITDYDDTDYGPNNDGITDYDDTDYGPNNDGITDYDDTDYGPNNDGITDYDDTDYGPNNDGITDYDDTDYGPNNDGITDYDDTDYGSNNDGLTDYNDNDNDDDDDDDDDD